MNKKFAKYATATATGAVAASTTAFGNIQYSGPINLDLSAPTTDTLWIDLDGLTAAVAATNPGGADFKIQTYSATEFDFYGLTFNEVGITGNDLQEFSNGSLISSSETFAEYASLPDGSSFTNTSGQYAGLQFEVGIDTFYGWAQIEYDQASNQITLVDFAYDDSGAAISAGAIPEPSQTAAIMGILLAGSTVAFNRRRKQSA